MAAEARRRWLAAPIGERSRWAIKWAAPVRRGEGAGTAEHLWLEPSAWHEERIEGFLLNAPRRSVGFAEGDLVSVPLIELSDWIESSEEPAVELIARLVALPPDAEEPPRHRGGFTVEVLRRHLAPE